MYLISGGSVKISNHRYTPIKNDYCLILGYSAKVELCAKDSRKIATEAYSFTDLAMLQNISPPCAVDIIAVVLEVQEIE